jgi:uncharacterized protein DUF5343
MPTQLPYLASPGSIKSGLERIKSAATPDRVTGDFITTKLQIRGGTGKALVPFLKKIGFVHSDGTPSELYKRFRNPSFSKAAVADAIKAGYRELSDVNEYFYELNDKDLLGLIVQVTGSEPRSQVAKLTLATLQNLKSFADFEQSAASRPASETLGKDPASKKIEHGQIHPTSTGNDLKLSYTINLNLPATADPAVFNAIFKSLRNHLLSYDND